MNFDQVDFEFGHFAGIFRQKGLDLVGGFDA